MEMQLQNKNMKIAKIIYLIVLFLTVIICYVMFRNNWNIFGGLLSLICFSAFINYIDIEQNNLPEYGKTQRRRRTAYVKSLTEKQKEEFFEYIKEELEKFKKSSKSNS